jgi:hypothetical protein
MSAVKSLLQQIVSDLESAGEGSLYSADANEPDPRYKGYGVPAERKAAIIKKHRPALRILSESAKLALAHRLVESRYGEQQSVTLDILEGGVQKNFRTLIAWLDVCMAGGRSTAILVHFSTMCCTTIRSRLSSWCVNGTWMLIWF